VTRQENQESSRGETRDSSIETRASIDNRALHHMPTSRAIIFSPMMHRHFSQLRGFSVASINVFDYLRRAHLQHAQALQFLLSFQTHRVYIEPAGEFIYLFLFTLFYSISLGCYAFSLLFLLLSPSRRLAVSTLCH
jgi:hypothetical protein